MGLKKLIQRMLVMVGLFAVCAVAITYAGIQKAKQENKGNSLENPTPTMALTEISIMPTQMVEQPTPTPVERGIDLYGTYDANDLLIRTVLAPREDDTEIRIPQIDGLKDLEIQEKINQDMYNRVGKLLRAYPEINYGDYYVRGNFANVLSISYYMSGGERYDQLYLNYNLVTGERLELEDLFLQEADIIQCVRRAFYDMLARENMYSEDMEWGSDVALSPDENQVYKLVKGYMESEDYQFMFTPSEICFYYEDYVASLRMVDEADQIAVYSRFLTEESIFMRDDIGFKNVFTCADTQYDAFEKIEYGYLEPNFWYDVTIWKTYMEENLEAEQLEGYVVVKESFYDSMSQKIAEYRELAKQNPDKFYMLFLKPAVHIYYSYDSERYANIAEFSANGVVYEMPMEVYEATYRDKLLEAYRYVYFVMAGGAYMEWEEGDDAIRKTLDDAKAYNYMTGAELTELDDIFYKDSGYMDVIRARTWDTLAWKTEYSWAEIDALVDTLECRLEGISVYVTIPSLEDFYFRLVLGEFEDNMLKIFD